MRIGSKANSEAGCRRSRNQLRVLSSSIFAYDVNRHVDHLRCHDGAAANDPRMQVCLLKSKIHRATITDGNLKYEGSLTIAADASQVKTELASIIPNDA